LKKRGKLHERARAAFKAPLDRLFALASKNPGLALSLSIAVLAAWAWNLKSNYEACQAAWFALGKMLEPEHESGLGGLAALWLVGQLVLSQKIHAELASAKAEPAGWGRRVVSAALVITAVTAFSPARALDGFGPRLEALMMLVSAAYIGFLYYELWYGAGMVLGAIGIAGMVLGGPALMLVLLTSPLWGAKGAPFWLMFSCLAGPIILLALAMSAVAPICMYAATVAVLTFHVGMPQTRDVVFELYRRAFFLAFPVYALGILCTDPRVLRRFLALNLPFLFGPEAEAEGFAGRGGSSGGAGAGGTF
jgi:hypothetical protein